MTFLERLDAEAREVLLSAATPVSFVSGSQLVRQGEAARGAYVLRAGEAEAIVSLPGGESLTVARLVAGGMFGEMALIELGICTATVRAATNVDGWFVAHEDFRALVSQRSRAALAIQHAVTSILAEKLATLNAKLIACAAPEDRPARAIAAGEPLAAVERLRTAPFAVEGFLPKLPFFERFSPDEIDEVAAGAAYLDLARGQALFRAGDAAAAAYLVLRGAVEIVATHGERERRMAVLGPGQLVGYLSVLQEHAHSTHAFMREPGVLMEIAAPAFREIYFGDSGAAARVRFAVDAGLLAAMGRTNRALTRLITQAQLEGAVEPPRELEAALHGQLATAKT